ncbi:MAG: hypothetical protein J6V34_03805 [Oscillospiraceae bacterium]|nr:hypothetical protein [Oscillospiraceae bacterium]
MKSKFLTLLLSLAISFGLWLYVVTVISPESESVFYDIPVELVGKDYLNHQNLIIVSSTDDLRVDLTLRGNRSDLKKLNSSNITVIADLSKITKPGEHNLDCSISFQSGTAEPMAQNPEKITVVVAEKLTKTVPIDADYTGSVADGYQEDKNSTSLDHTTVTISGPKETIDKITSAKITVDLSGKMATFVEDYQLVLCGMDNRPVADISFVTTNVSVIRTVVQINKVKIVPVRFELDYTDSGLRDDGTMVTAYASVETVTLIGSSEALDMISDVIPFKIKLKDHSGSFTESFTLDLPEGVRCLEEIKIHVSIPEIDAITVTVQQFDLRNVPEGMRVQITEQPTIMIRGPKEVLASLKVDEVLCIIDCTGATAASTALPASYKVVGYEYLHVYPDANSESISVTVTEE